MKFHLGKGTIITLLLALSVVGYTLYQRNMETKKPPIIENKIISSTSRGIAPVPEYLLRHKQELNLSSKQVKQLSEVADAFRKDIAPVKKRLDIASKELQEYVERHKGDSRLDTKQFVRQSAEVKQLSGVSFTTRLAYWEQACSLLNAEQKQRADTLAKQATPNDLL